VEGAWEAGSRDNTYKDNVGQGFGGTGRDNRQLGMTNGWQNVAKMSVQPPWGTN
jgi:hypothetical protein